MPIVETFSGTELAPVVVAQDGPVAHVWMRRNIGKDVKDPENGEGEPYEFWHAEELAFTMSGSPTVQEIQADFDAIWDAQLDAGKTVPERIKELTAFGSDNSDALAELGDMVAEQADAIAELGDMVASIKGGE